MLLESLISFGYEKTKNWIKALDNIEPVEYEVHSSKLPNRRKGIYLALISFYLENAGIDPAKFLSPFKKLYKLISR